MAKFCTQCGKPFPFFSSFSSKTICDVCDKKIKTELLSMKEQIIKDKTVIPSQINFIKAQPHELIIKLYSDLVDTFESDKELDENEIQLLKELQSNLGLSDDEIKFDSKILPYIFVLYIKQENKLPVYSKATMDDGSKPILKKDEVLHYGSITILKEMKTVSHTYQGGSHGFSFRVTKGVSYRIGAHRGQIQPDIALVETSRGVLLITNKRLYLHPHLNNKPLVIPLNKITSYRCHSNGLEIFKEGREKGYFFSLNEGPSEIVGICLGFLLERGE
jgi:hypothetical protein